MSELTDKQIKVWLGEVYGYAVYTVYPREKHVARSAYALGREAGLKEAAAICENSPWHFSRDGLCASLANTIRERIATPSDSPADVKNDAPMSKVTDEMVNRFLGWKLPRDFGPDAGVSFTPPANPHWWPIGTNLLTAEQARAMLEYVLSAAP